MTFVSEIIEEAFRESGLTNELQSATPTQTRQALGRLQTIVSSSYGFEVGEPLVDWPIGFDQMVHPSGISWDATIWNQPRPNARLIAGNTEPQTIFLPTLIDDGARISLIDPGGRLEGAPITLLGNGRTIEGGVSYVANTNNLNRTWMYRADLGNWVAINPLTFTDTFPFPEEFDAYFITVLALRLNPTYGASLDPQSQLVLDRTRIRLSARYQQIRFEPSEMGLLRMSDMTADRERWSFDGTAFDKGRPW